MKYRERLGYIALGGFLMLVGMLAGAFSPLGSHDEKADLNVGEITCTGLSVVDEDGLRVLIRNRVAVLGKTGGMASMGIDHDGYGGEVRLYGKDMRSKAVLHVDETGGIVEVVRGRGEKQAVARMSIAEHGGFVYVDGKDGESWAGMVIGEHGGVVSMNGKDGKSKAGIGIDEVGGVVNLYGKDGELNRLTPE